LWWRWQFQYHHQHVLGVTLDEHGSTTTATTLQVVAPVIDCSQLASVDITDIGGAGSKIARRRSPPPPSTAPLCSSAR
jgi:hypothetical protein